MTGKTTSDSAHVWLSDAIQTEAVGASLARTIHTLPVTILLRGEIGAGKTTFLRGFLGALGVKSDVVSPTYALEQRYETAAGLLLHIDLYRLNTAEAALLLREIDPAAAIVCIEWPDRFGGAFDEPVIDIGLTDATDGRAGRGLSIAFDPLPLPSDDMIERWRNDVCLPDHIRAHCDAVAAAAVRCATALLQRGVLVRTDLVEAAAKTHDLLKFVDFDGSQRHLFPGVSDETEVVWKNWRSRFAGLRHEAACAAFLASHGFQALAQTVRPHGAGTDPSVKRKTIEDDVLYYADKRVCGDKTVTLTQRYQDFRDRYAAGEQTPLARALEDDALRTERMLFPDGPPF